MGGGDCQRRLSQAEDLAVGGLHGLRRADTARGQQVLQHLGQLLILFRTLQHHQTGELQQRLPAVPTRQTTEGIPTDDQEQGSVRAKLRAQRLQGFNRVGRTLAAQLTVVHQQLVIGGRRQTEHLQTLLRRRTGSIPARRTGLGYQAQLIQAQAFPPLNGTAKRTEMNRDQGTAEDPAAYHCRMCPSPRTMYFSLVSPSSPTGPRACSLSVEIPISAPSPYSKPSANRVEALTITELESTSARKRRARVKSSVTIDSVCCEL